jgi:hypothetical protein
MNRKAPLQQVVYAIFFAIVGYYSVVYFALHYSNSGYIESFSGNLLATLLGVAIGLPAALYLDRVVNARHEEGLEIRRVEQQLAELNLIREELEAASRDIATRRDLNDIVLPPINTQLWRTLQPSDHIREVKDLHIIVKIGDAYNRIHAHQVFELQYHSILHTHGANEAAEDAKKHFVTDLRNMDTETLDSIETAVKAVKDYVKKYRRT